MIRKNGAADPPDTYSTVDLLWKKFLFVIILRNSTGDIWRNIYGLQVYSRNTRFPLFIATQSTICTYKPYETAQLFCPLFFSKNSRQLFGISFSSGLCGATVPSHTDSEFPIGIFDIVNIPDQLNKNDQIDDTDLELQIYIFWFSFFVSAIW